jgi:hypothetical protein
MALEKTLEIELLFRALALMGVDATVVPLSVRVRSQAKLSLSVCFGGGEGWSVGNIHWVTRLEKEGVGVLGFEGRERGMEGRREEIWDGIVLELIDDGLSLVDGEYFEGDVFGESVYRLFDAGGVCGKIPHGWVSSTWLGHGVLKASLLPSDSNRPCTGDFA